MFATEPSSKRFVEQPEALCLEQLAALCKASGDPRRLQVLRVLRHDSLGVLELCSIFDMRQPAMSHHLKVLASAGLVTSRREGNTIFYRRAPLSQHRALTALQNSLFLAVDQLLLPAPVVQRLALLHAQRAQSSQQFFQQNADKFRAQQDLIASPFFDLYYDFPLAIGRFWGVESIAPVPEVLDKEGVLTPVQHFASCFHTRMEGGC